MENYNLISSERRIIPTVSSFAKDHLLYVQEIGELTSKSPHISTRNNIFSFLFFVVEKGSGLFSYRGEKASLKAGDCIFINCQNAYSHESSKNDPWTLSWVHFYGHELKSVYDRYEKNGYSYLFHPLNTSDILGILNSLYSINENITANTEIISNKYLNDIITFAFTTNNCRLENSETTIDKLKSIREYMRLNYGTSISLDKLSKQFFISKYHLAREYKKLYGTTTMADLTAIRISQAKSMLRFSNESVEEIASLCGFSDCGYFIKVFNASEGMTPLTYRKKW